MATRCEDCGRRLDPALCVARTKDLLVFQRCRCGRQDVEVQDGGRPQVELRRGRGQVSLRLKGPGLYLLAPEALEAALAPVVEEIESNPANLVANLEEVAYVGPGVLAVLDRLRASLAERGHSLALVSTSSSFRALLERETPGLGDALADTERKATALLARSEL